MDEEQIKKLISSEVDKKLKAEKQLLATMIENNFLYTGEFAKASLLIDVINQWSRRQPPTGPILEYLG